MRRAETVDESLVADKTYRLSRAGRRMAYILLAGAVLVWLFALWTLKNTLDIGLRPENLGPSLRNLAHRLTGAEGAQPLTPEEAIPSLVMLVLLVVVPLLIWNIIEEMRAAFTVGADGVTFRSVGVELSYPWAEVETLRPVDEEADEPLYELVLSASRLSSIRNPLARFLHWQAYGRRKLPLYGGLQDREDLLADIQAGIASVEPPAAEAAEEAVSLHPTEGAAEELAEGPAEPTGEEPVPQSTEAYPGGRRDAETGAAEEMDWTDDTQEAEGASEGEEGQVRGEA